MIINIMFLNDLENLKKEKVLKDACIILKNSYKASKSFYDIFKILKKQNKMLWEPSNEEQDLLRAMLLFAASGLDAVIKQLIKDSLSTIIKSDEKKVKEERIGVYQQFESYVFRKIKDKKLDKDDSRVGVDIKFLSQIIANNNPQQLLIKECVSDLTNNSLQSKDELLKVAAHFAITAKEIVSDIELIDKIFKIRNEIIHEMDIDFDQLDGNRRPRKESDMLLYTKTLINTAFLFIKAVQNKLKI